MMFTNATSHLRIDAPTLLPVVEGANTIQTPSIWVMGVVAMLALLLLFLSFITRSRNTVRGVVWRFGAE